MTSPRRPPTNRELMQAKKSQTPNPPNLYQSDRELLASIKSPDPKKSSAVATPKSTAVAVPDPRPYRDRYYDEIAPASIVGRLVKFSKDGQFITADDEQPVPSDAEFAVLADQTMIGWLKFNGDGEAPDREMGLLYDGFVMPLRESLGDLDKSKWEMGLSNEPQDPWQHFIYLVLQNTATQELFTYTTSSKTGRRACGNLLRHYDRMRKTHPDELPRVRLSAGGFEHKDSRVGWVSVPLFVVVGRTPRDGVATPEPTTTGAFLNDTVPF
jgi:hypothetical protein